MIKTNAKDLFFKAALCYLANDDLVGAKRAIQNYRIDDPNFDGSREDELLNVSSYLFNISVGCTHCNWFIRSRTLY